MTLRQRVTSARNSNALLGLVLLLAVAACDGDGPSAVSMTPSISGTPTTQARVGQTYSFTPTAHSSVAAMGFTVSQKPTWTSFNTATGQLTGTPQSTDVGTYPNIVISVSNGAASAALRAFTITVAQGGMVTLNWQAPTTNTDGSPLTDLAGYTIDYGTDASALNQSVTIGSPATTSYAVQNLTSGVWYFAVTADTTDGLQSARSDVVSTTVD